MLCLGYIQSSHIIIQFINLNGQIINAFSKEVALKTAEIAKGCAFSSAKLIGYLKYGMQLRNIPNGGFCLFYGDNDAKRQLLVFDGKGNLTHEKDVPLIFATHYFMRATATDVYLLMKDNEQVPEGGYKLTRT